MAFQLSPGVNVTEYDITTVVPAVATTDGAIGGVFRWGPVGKMVLVDSEDKLVNAFGRPTNYNAETFFTAANYLSYTNRLWVSRAANTSGSSPYALLETANTSANNVLVRTNSTDLATIFEAGMYVSQTTNSTSVPVGVTIESVNSTSITLSDNYPAADIQQLTVYFGRPETSYSAVAMPTGSYVANLVNQIITSENDFDVKIRDTTTNGLIANNNIDSDVLFIAKYPGELGNSLRVSVVDSVTAYTSTISEVGDVEASFLFSVEKGSANGIIVADDSSNAALIASSIAINDKILVGNSTIGKQYLKVVDITQNGANVNLVFEDRYRLKVNTVEESSITRYWEFSNIINQAPGSSKYAQSNGSSVVDEMHLVVIDELGKFTGTPGTVLETYVGMSRASDSRNENNTTNFWRDIINQNSAFIWATNDSTYAPSATLETLEDSTATAPGYYQFTLGSDGTPEDDAGVFNIVAEAYDLFQSPETVDISLVLAGRPVANTLMAQYIIDNITETRRDCVVFISPDKDTTLNAFGTEAQNIVDWRNDLSSTSYGVIDSGYKYQYDRYNDVYRWIPLNGDVAGLCARTDQTNDAWWSPAGLNRGNIKNVVRLAYNPRKAERDLLYMNGVNPIITLNGQGTVLYGDKTMLKKPSAFDRINVRRLFIVLEKAIATSAKYSLFEFNDAFTRAQFRNLVIPFLRTVQGRRGITDFSVVCDETNNTPQIIDTNQFVGDIYIKPARSINYIQLNFVAVGSGVQFSEVIGRF